MLVKIQKKKRLYFLFLCILLSVCNACIEEIEVEEIESFESTLVIEATITNELKQQRIMLSRAFQFGGEGAMPENEANVSIVDDMGNTIRFSEIEPGIYESLQNFQAQAGRNYNLSIITSNGRRYASEIVQLTQETSIENVSAQRIVNASGRDGIVIAVNTFDPTNTSNFYRYEYEETFMIIAPNWVSEDLVAPPEEGGVDECIVELTGVRDPNERICYGTGESNEILLANTAGLEEDRVSNFVIRFINRDNYILSHRYSILVRQFVQSSAAHVFFETLINLSESDDVFSQLQPGLLVGNVFSEDDENEIVLGYFDMASVSEKRIFFDYEDFFPGEPLPPYVVRCLETSPPFFLPTGNGVCGLSTFVRSNSVKYLRGTAESVNEEINPEGGPFVVVPRVCGDCTAVGSSTVPSFWIE